MSKTLNTNEFYKNPDLGISSEHYDIVLGFFKRVTSNIKTAETFTVDLFRVAKSTNVSVLTLLESMQDKDTFGVNEVMAFYLNQIRSQSALLGVQNTITPNSQVARNILA